MDKQVIELFIKWQEKKNKYRDLDIEKVEFEEKILKEIANFPSMTRVSGGIDLNNKDFNNLEAEDKNKYIPLVSGTVENNQISGYILHNRLVSKSISKSNIISWTRINGTKFFLQDKPVCTNDDSFVLEAKENIDVFYLQKALIGTQANSQFDWMNKAGQAKIKALVIPVPHQWEDFSSYQIQHAIVEFLGYRLGLIETTQKQINPIQEKVELLDNVMLSKIFEMKDPYIREQFDKWAEGSGYRIGADALEFEERQLKQISTIVSGQSPNGEFLNDNNEGTPFYQGKTEFTQMYIGSPKRWTEASKKTAKTNDLLISMRAPAGAVNIATQICSIGRGLSAVTPNKDIVLLYLFYFFKKIEQKLNFDNDKGGFFSSMTKSELADIDIFIPKTTPQYSSYQLQQILIEFIEAFYVYRDKILNTIDDIYFKLDKLEEGTIALIFKGEGSD